MNNKENMQATQTHNPTTSPVVLNNMDKINGNTDNVNGRQGDHDNSGNILTVKNDSSIQNTKNNATDVQNANTSSQQSYKAMNNTQTTSNLRKTQLAKSNPQINMTSPYTGVHPLSSSIMETSKNYQRNSRSDGVSQNSLNGSNSQTRHFQSSNQSNDEALRRLTAQFTPLQIPIVGYEVMEERAKFTIYKLRIDDPRTSLSWMVFRRYTDFVRLYQKLRIEHRNLILPLPEKRLFRNNFDPLFLEERTRGLQLFVNSIVNKLSFDRNVREFLCLDEPPEVGDSEPETQAMFGAFEDTVGSLKNQLKNQEDTIKYLKQKVFYLEEKMKDCSSCNPLRNGGGIEARTGHSLSSSSSNGS